MFASSARPDRFPHRVGKVRLAYEGTLNGERSTLDPRPFDPAMHNGPNPILALWRETNDGDMRGWGVWLALAAHDMVQDGQATADHKDHARRVLTRLAEIGA